MGHQININLLAPRHILKGLLRGEARKTWTHCIFEGIRRELIIGTML